MKYRKKPIVVDAFQMTLERMNNNTDWPEWLHRAWQKDNEVGSLYPDKSSLMEDGRYGHQIIRTLKGDLYVSPDDWIILGVSGEITPCKSDIFEKTYESVSAE